MTRLLDAVVEQASKLPDDEQDRWARLWLEELRADARWDKLLSSSQAQLEALADEATGEHREGRTETLDPDEL